LMHFHSGTPMHFLSGVDRLRVRPEPKVTPQVHMR